MSKIFSVYSKNVDKVWYQSSNVKYSECIDNEGELKTLKVVFNNGTQYQYTGVDVNQYLLFREDDSQGKALNKYIKGNNYEYSKLEDANLEYIEDELNFRMEGGYFVEYNGEILSVKDNKDSVIYEREVKLTEEAFGVVCDIIRAMGHEIFVEGGSEFYILNDREFINYNDGEERDTRHIYGGIG